jgi:hypothetical protein
MKQYKIEFQLYQKVNYYIANYYTQKLIKYY